MPFDSNSEALNSRIKDKQIFQWIFLGIHAWTGATITSPPPARSAVYLHR